MDRHERRVYRGQMRAATILKLLRGGHARARLSAFMDGQAAVRVAAVGAGLETGLLPALRSSPATVSALATRCGWADVHLVEGLLHVLAGIGLVRVSGGRWSLARRGRAVLEDEVVRAAYEGFSDYHVALYRELDKQLAGGPGRHDVTDKGDVVARLSQAMDPFVLDVLDARLERHRPSRILDIGCGSGHHLAHLLRALPEAEGVGIEPDAAAAALARGTFEQSGLAERTQVVEGDVREVLDDLGSFDLVLLANVVYYFPFAQRVPLLRSIAERLTDDGSLVVVTHALTRATFSRHFDLLLRAQEGEMGLPDLDVLLQQLRDAGLAPGKPRRIAPGEPLTAVVATRP
jgi:SAM-dependent methyltransferase